MSLVEFGHRKAGSRAEPRKEEEKPARVDHSQSRVGIWKSVPQLPAVRLSFREVREISEGGCFAATAVWLSCSLLSPLHAHYLPLILVSRCLRRQDVIGIPDC